MVAIWSEVRLPSRDGGALEVGKKLGESNFRASGEMTRLAGVGGTAEVFEYGTLWIVGQFLGLGMTREG